MSQQNKPRERKIGTKQPEKKPLIDPRYKSLIYTIAVIVVIAIFFIVNNSKSEPDQGPLPPNFQGAVESPYQGQNAANFELPTPDGKKLKLSDYKGKVVIVDFWATWCPPCRKGIPDLVELKKKYGSKGLEIIGVSVDEDNTKPAVVPFVKQYGINYPVVYANDDVRANYGGIASIPTSFVIDQSGKIVASYEGLTDRSNYEKEINKLLGNS